MERKLKNLEELQRIKSMENPSNKDLYHAYLHARDIVIDNIIDFIKKTYKLSMSDYIKSVVKHIGSILENEYQPLINAKNNKVPSNVAQPSIYIDIVSKEWKAGSYRIKGGYYVGLDDINNPFLQQGGKFCFNYKTFIEPEKYFGKEIAEKIKKEVSLLNEYPKSRGYDDNIRDKYKREYRYEENPEWVWYGYDGIAYSEDPAVKKWIY